MRQGVSQGHGFAFLLLGLQTLSLPQASIWGCVSLCPGSPPVVGGLSPSRK